MVKSPTRPLPISAPSIETIPITSVAVPVKNISSEDIKSSTFMSFSTNSISKRFAISITVFLVMPPNAPVSIGGVCKILSLKANIF